MAKNSFGIFNKIIFFTEKYVAAAFICIAGLTWRYKIHGEIRPADRNLYIFWHRNIIPLAWNRSFEKIAIMISSSKDGELISGPVSVLGYIPVRGSATRGGSKALRAMKKLAETNNLAVTPDGPKGPAYQIKDGTWFLAYITGLPVVTVAVDCEKEWTFNSWDKLRLPKPFSKINIRYGKPVYIKNKEEIPLKKEITIAEFKKSEEKNKFKK
ncbi:MAG: hypothetical protein CSB55_07710 [Candidatus Cloacimonadota bacterium]|nr:MAG: hypothetical protein CSB55_07710 [Candidatus Cloacimonadota bacterium]